MASTKGHGKKARAGRRSQQKAAKKVAGRSSPPRTSTLQARLIEENKEIIAKAASLRHVGLSDYIRLVLVPAARREVELAEQQVLHMTPEEQLTFWEALQAPVEPTPSQRELGRLMRGES